MSNEQLCRLCANLSLSLVDINCCSSDGISLNDLIQNYLTLKLEVLDGFPSAVVCTNCHDQLLLFHHFVGQVHEAQKKIEKLMNIEEDAKLYNNNKVMIAIESDVTQDVKVEFNNDLSSDENNKMDGNFEQFEPQLKLEEFSERKKRRKARKKEEFADEYDSDEVLATLKRHQLIETASGTFFRKRPKKLANIKKHKSKNTDVLPEESEPNPCKCYVCNNSFKSHSALWDHQTETHILKGEEKKWPCTYCNNRFKSRSNAQRHIQTVHERTGDFICHLCGKAYNTLGNLKEHLYTHADEPLFECKICDKKFKLRTALKRHKKVHSGKRVKCPKCQISLSGERTLYGHMFTHDEVGREECHVCGKRFKLKKTLKVHLITHTGQQPYRCLWCPKTFANNSNCRIHKKRVHKAELKKYEAERDAKSK